MPWVPVNELRDAVMQLGLLAKPHNCPNCGTGPGQPHKNGCTVERCSSCGGQRLSCGCEGPHDEQFARWTGFWPGELECLALGMLSRWQPDPSNPVPADSLCTKPGVDLNRFSKEGWPKLFWIKPAGS